MDRKATDQRLKEILDEFAQERAFGTVEITIRHGVPVLINRTRTEKTQEGIEHDRKQVERR
jgi:hypothetical protein